MSFKIKGGIGSLGYRREGGGGVLYIFKGKFDFAPAIAAMEIVVSHAYTDKHEGEIDFAEYDSSIISTDRFEIEDDVPRVQSWLSIMSANCLMKKTKELPFSLPRSSCSTF